MKKVNKEVLKSLANSLMFEMEPAQYDALLEDLDNLIEQMKIIEEIPQVDDVEPMTFPFPVATSYLREDVIETPLAQEDALKNAYKKSDGYIILPKVVKK